MTDCKECRDCCDNGKYFEVSWTEVDGDYERGGTNYTCSDVCQIKDFIEEVVRPLCRSFGFVDSTIDEYIKDGWN